MTFSPTRKAAPGAKQHPFGDCLYFTANAVARQISRMADEAFARTGLCPSGGMLLHLVVDRPGIAPSEAAELLHLAPSSVTRFADGLHRKELVRREHSGRHVLLHPTAAGKKLDKQVRSCWEELYRRYSGSVGVQKGRKLARELCDVAAVLNQERG